MSNLVSLLYLPADIRHILEKLLDLVRVLGLVQIQAGDTQHGNKI